MRNNGSNPLSFSTNGPYTLASGLTNGTSYDVTAANSTTTGQTCTVTNPSGTINGANVTNVLVTCSSSTYTLGGTVSGLTVGTTLVLQNNDDQTISQTTNGSFAFLDALANGSPYNVTVKSQPSGQTCTVTNPTGTINGANVTTVSVSCQGTTATLTASVSNLALATSGQSRIITITNAGTTSAGSVGYTATNLPLDTSVLNTATNACPSANGTLAAGETCTITVVPGSTASSNTSGDPCDGASGFIPLYTLPAASTITVTASGASPVSTNVYVLNYGCIYQGGYIFSIDDTTANTGSIAGKVVAQSGSSIGTIWGSNGASGTNGNDMSADYLPGIDEISTPSSPSPTYSGFSEFFSGTYTNRPVPDAGFFTPCFGAYDGACNTLNIYNFYNTYTTNNESYNGGSPPYEADLTPTTLSYYPAGICTNYSYGSYEDWYLPAICEMGPGEGGLKCSVPNIVDNLPDLMADPGTTCPTALCNNGAGCLCGSYWSSTTSINDPYSLAFFYYFEQGNTLPSFAYRYKPYLAICARAF